MTVHSYKCACRQCGRQLVIDTDAGMITLNDFLLDFSETVTADKVTIVKDSLSFDGKWDFVFNNTVEKAARDIIFQMQKEIAK